MSKNDQVQKHGKIWSFFQFRWVEENVLVLHFNRKYFNATQHFFFRKCVCFDIGFSYFTLQALLVLLMMILVMLLYYNFTHLYYSVM